MVLDTSALVAILQCEPERPRFLEASEAADTSLVRNDSRRNSIVIEFRYGSQGLHGLDRLIAKAGVESGPVVMSLGEPLLSKGDNLVRTDLPDS